MPTSQSWMWVQTGGPPNQPVILCYYSTSRAQEVPSRLPEGYRGYLMTDDYASYNALGAQAGVERLGCWAHARRKFVEAQKVQPKGKTGRAYIALNLINKLYGIERDLKVAGDEHRREGRQQNSLSVLAQLHAWLEKTQHQVTAQNALIKVYWRIRFTDVPPAENPNFLFEVTDQWMTEVPSKQKLMPKLGGA